MMRDALLNCFKVHFEPRKPLSRDQARLLSSFALLFKVPLVPDDEGLTALVSLLEGV